MYSEESGSVRTLSRAWLKRERGKTVLVREGNTKKVIRVKGRESI